MGYELEMEEIREENSINPSPSSRILKKLKYEVVYELEKGDTVEEQENSIDLSPSSRILRKLKETMFKYLRDSKIF